MKRACLAVAIFAACVALAAGQAKLCENSRAPGEVSDTKILSNTYDAGSKTSKLQLQWASPVKNPASGCVDGYTVEIFDGARKVGSDNVPGSPSLKTVQHTVAANPGATVTFKVVAKNSATGKQSSPVTVIPSSVKAAAAPPTQGVKPL